MSLEQIQKAWTYSQFNNVEALSEIVPSEVSVDASTKSEKNHIHTLLMAAAAAGAEETCEYLISHGAKVNKKNPMGFTALHWAAYCGRYECVKQLVKGGADFTDKTQDGRTVIHIAALRGHQQFIEHILELGADINECSSNGWCALHYTIIGNQSRVAQFLIDNGIEYKAKDCDLETIYDLVEKYHRNWINDLIKQDSSEDEKAKTPQTPSSRKSTPRKQ